ncbi:hypothetical protein AKJ44_02735 [candidate division MSBL1 archaeon SCGC-AAA261F17]|uniref:Uncharacterized protein n=1 Tax=candidate division MSBL1 archaeon SCGC-AAA261F17 TaxID=1698274 RepID=A0A133V498_9EURY|nr:hypothetical protein AKJ44_02735 [candidate division MSBL1 archaeon SCGC-AAA261F17]
MEIASETGEIKKAGSKLQKLRSKFTALKTLKITVDGELDYPKIKSTIEEWGGVIHSVDEVVAGRKPAK